MTKRLEVYLTDRNESNIAFATRIAVDPSLVGRWIRRETVPSAENMRRIYIATDGEVEPNDFYNLPKLPRRAADPKRRVPGPLPPEDLSFGDFGRLYKDEMRRRDPDAFRYWRLIRDGFPVRRIQVTGPETDHRDDLKKAASDD